MEKLHLRGGPDKIRNVLSGAGYHSNHKQSRWHNLTTPPTNYIGTALFLSYIAAALALTSFIVIYELRPRWNSYTITSKRSVHLVAALAMASFSVLSFNMLNFLYESFNGYLRASQQDLSTEQIWPWMLNSNLFTSFARSLLFGQDRTTWTMQGLMMTMIIGSEMSSLGRQHKIQHLWTYFCLGQILPPSFAYYCLQLRAYLSTSSQGNIPKEKSQTEVAPLDVRQIILGLATIAITTVSIITLDGDSGITDSDWKVLSRVLWLRILLFIPLFIDTGCVLPASAQDRARSVFSNQYFITTAIFAAILYGRQMATHDLSAFHAGFSSPAIRTLSLDWMIKIGGDILWTILVR